MSPQFKVAWIWFVATVGPTLGVLYNDIYTLTPPTREHWGQWIVTMLISLGVLQSKRPGDHRENQP